MPVAKHRVVGVTDHLHPEPFYLVLIDRDHGVFNVVGPVVDDAPYVRVVSRAQLRGRNIDLHNPGEFESRDEVLREIGRTTGFVYSEKPIVEPDGS